MDYWYPTQPIRDVPLTLPAALEQVAFAVAFGVVVLLALVVQFAEVRELYGKDESATPGRRTNCPSCGSRIAADSEACAYCGESTDG